MLGDLTPRATISRASFGEKSNIDCALLLSVEYADLVMQANWSKIVLEPAPSGNVG
jgi:hypothetical protein